MPDSIHDDIRAAMDAGTDTPPTGTPPSPPAGHDDFAPQRSEILPPVQPDNKDINVPPKEAPKAPEEKPLPQVPPRGPDGKFLPTGTPPAPAAPSTPPEPGEGSVRFDPAKPPAAWTQPMKDKWGTLPEDVRTEITRREEATANGVQKLMQHYEPMQEVFNVVAPFEGYFEHIQEDPRQYLHSMITMEQTLRLGNPAQKMELLLAVAETYGVPIRNALNEAMGGKLNEMLQRAHEQHRTPPPIPPQVQRELQEHRQWREQIENSAAESELAEFAAQPGHEFLDSVRDDMANLLESGVVETYQDAYDLAVWRNPQLRAQAMAQSNGQQQLTGVAARHAAAAAVVAPSAPAIVTADPNEGSGDIYDDVRKAWNASASGGRA